MQLTNAREELPAGHPRNMFQTGCFNRQPPTTWTSSKNVSTLLCWPAISGPTFRRRLPQVLRFSFNAPGPGAYAVKTMMALLHRLDEQQTLKDVTNIAPWILVNSSYFESWCIFEFSFGWDLSNWNHNLIGICFQRCFVFYVAKQVPNLTLPYGSICHYVLRFFTRFPL